MTESTENQQHRYAEQMRLDIHILLAIIDKMHETGKKPFAGDAATLGQIRAAYKGTSSVPPA